MGKEAEQKTIFSGDQAVFSQWDSLIKLMGLVQSPISQGRVIRHEFHLVDGVGKNSNPSPDAQFAVTNEHFRFKDGKEIQPSWFAVSDAMPFLALESMLPRKITEMSGRKLDVLAKDLIAVIRVLTPEERSELESTVHRLGHPGGLPTTEDGIIKDLTQGNWLGVVDADNKSASSYSLKDMEEAQRQLMVKLYRAVVQSLPKEEKEKAKARFLAVIGADGIVYSNIKDKPLAQVAEETFKILSSVLKRLADVDFNGIALSETTESFRLPLSPEDARGDEHERFLFLNWYLNHRQVYDKAHNKVSDAMSKSGENPIHSLSTAKGETPFWLVQEGRRMKMYLKDGVLSFDAYQIHLNQQIVSHQDLARVLSRTFPNQKFSLCPTAIPLLLQLRALGDVLLPEKGSSYASQANQVWEEIVLNTQAPEIRQLLQGDIIRVNPNALSALPAGKKVKLPWYLAKSFVKDHEGFTTTDEIKSQWKNIVYKRKKIIAAAKKQSGLIEKARILLDDEAIPSFEKMVSELEQLQVKDLEIRRVRKEIMEKLKAGLGKQNIALLGKVSAYLDGKVDVLPSDNATIQEASEELAKIRDASEMLRGVATNQKKLETLLAYYVALKYRELEGGAEALEYFDARPSLLTMYLLFGEEVVVNLSKTSEVYMEKTAPEPKLTTGIYDAEGNRILIVEDKLGLFEKSPADKARLIKAILRELSQDDMDTALVLTSSADADSDYNMLVIEKDGSISNMCGNGVRAAARFVHEKYGKEKIRLRTPSGEIVIGQKANGDEKYEARLSKVVYLESQTIPLFGDLISQNLQAANNPLSKIQMLAERQGIGVKITAVVHILQEPHMLVAHEKHLDEEVLRQAAIKLMSLRDPKGEKVFPHGININFIKEGEKGVRLITYERGVNDFTGSCGTGAVCAASLLLGRNGTSEVDFTTKEGKINVTFQDGHYVIRGNVMAMA